MKTKRLFNTSEYKTFNEIRKVLEGEGFYIYPEMQLRKVIEFEEGEAIPKKEKETFNTAYFDFVLYNNKMLPEFVIEFDGPLHLTDRKKRLADIRKNRICERANLPLLRIDDSFLTEYEEVSLLGYIVKRFVAYRNKMGEISREVNEKLLDASPFGDVDYHDPWNDPGFIFDINHPFPISTEIAARLYNKYGIVTSHVDTETYGDAISQHQYLEFQGVGGGDVPISDYARRMERRYRLERQVQDSLGKYDSEIIHELSISVDYTWGAPASEESDSDHVVAISHVHFQSIPGTSMFELAKHLCDFFAIRELEKWTHNHLTIPSEIKVDFTENKGDKYV
jgi:hypothetical protein